MAVLFRFERFLLSRVSSVSFFESWIGHMPQTALTLKLVGPLEVLGVEAGFVVCVAGCMPP